MPRLPEQNKRIKDQRRAKLVGCALRVFAEVGYDQATVDAITKLNGCSHGLFYHYYDGIGEAFADVYETFVKTSPLYAYKDKMANAKGAEGIKIVCDLLEEVQKCTPRAISIAAMVRDSFNAVHIDEAKTTIREDFPIATYTKRFLKEAAEEGTLIDAKIEELHAAFKAIVDTAISERKNAGRNKAITVSSATMRAMLLKA